MEPIQPIKLTITGDIYTFSSDSKDLVCVTEDVFQRIFPNNRLGKSTSIAGKEWTALVYTKVQDFLLEKVSYGLAPPLNVSKEIWLCIAGRNCIFSKNSVGFIDINFAKKQFPVVSLNNQENLYDYSKFFHETVYPEFSIQGLNSDYSDRAAKKNKEENKTVFSNTVSEPFCLFPINKSEDLAHLRSVFPKLRHTYTEDCYFACVAHWEEKVSKDLSKTSKGTTTRSRMAKDPSKRGRLDLNFIKNRKSKDIENMAEYHQGLDRRIDADLQIRPKKLR